MFDVPDATFGQIASTSWATLDLDGDRFVDLVVTSEASDPTKALTAGGSPHWALYHGSAAGFATTPTLFAVPDARFSAVVYDGTPSSWATLDIDGDGFADLVIPNDPDDPLKTPSINGAPVWTVYRGAATGFAATPTTFSVPDTRFAAIASDTWATLDADGDGFPDLVISSSSTDPTKAFVDGGSAHWEVYRGSASGFATAATSFAVPDARFNAPFARSTTSSWATLDIDGDRVPDLVLPSDPSNPTKTFIANNAPVWIVYRGIGSGFATTPTMFGVPAQSFNATDTATTSASWGTLDIDGDGHADLVLPEDTANPVHAFVTGGTAHWLVYRGGCTP